MIKLAYNRENPNLVFEVEDIVRKSINVIGIVEYYRGTLVDTSTVPDTRTPNYDIQVMGFESNWEETPVDLGSTGNINNQNKTVSPTTEEQTIVPDAGYTGLNKVYVNAVNIDAAQTVTPTTEEQDINPSVDSLGIAGVKVNAVTADIDANIVAENIKQGVSILGIDGALAPGLDIQNGRKVNYKATSGIVPKGTFVKLNTSYEGLSYGYSSSAYVEDMLALNEKYIISVGTQGSSGSLYPFLAIHEVTESGITQKYRANQSTLSYSGMIKTFLYKLDDTHFAVFQPVRSSYNSSVTIYSYENEVLTMLSDTSYSDSEFDPTGSSYRDLAGVTYTEDDDYLCLHESGFRSRDVASGHKYLYCLKISKADYSVTLIPSASNINYCYYGLQNIDGHIVGSLNNNIGVIDFDTTTNVYTRVNTALGDYGFTNDRVSFAKVGNKILIVFAPNQNSMKYVEMSINQDKSVSLGAPVLFFEDAEAREAIYKFFKKNCVHASNLIVYSFNYSGPRYWAFVIRNENGIITTGGVNIISPAGSYADSFGFGGAVFASINNMLVGAPGYQTSSSNPIKIAKYEIDAGLNLNQNEGSAITVAAATGYIQGLTNTECTPGTAGEVYLLDTGA